MGAGPSNDSALCSGRMGPRGIAGGVGSGIGSGYVVDNGGHLTSEMEGDKMVLKINKPPRNKDSLSSLTGQSFSWLINVSRRDYLIHIRC